MQLNYNFSSLASGNFLENYKQTSFALDKYC